MSKKKKISWRKLTKHFQAKINDIFSSNLLHTAQGQPFPIYFTKWSVNSKQTSGCRKSLTVEKNKTPHISENSELIFRIHLVIVLMTLFNYVNSNASKYCCNGRLSSTLTITCSAELGALVLNKARFSCKSSSLRSQGNAWHIYTKQCAA